MSRQTLIETQLFRIAPQAITEAVKTERGNLLVEGRLQAAETKNGNGRSYPKKILEREIENYKKGPIAENRALGELDHPDSSVIISFALLYLVGLNCVNSKPSLIG